MSAIVEPSEYLTVADVLAHFHASRMWVARRTLDANFPKPIKCFPSNAAPRFGRLDDILGWGAERARINGGAS